MAKRPNVVFLITDDQRYGTIHALGNEQIHTPNMDSLVRRGVSFLEAHIPGATSSAVCMPSRGMLHSGRTLFHLQEDGKNIPEEDTTMCQAFRQQGYYTYGIGKWHNGVGSYACSFSGGRDIFFGGMWDHWNVPVSDFRADGRYTSQIHFTPNFSASSASVQVLADRINAGVHSTDLFSGDAVEFLREYDREEPFFLYLSFLAPHDPRTMPEEFRNMYDPEQLPLPPNFATMPLFSFGWCDKGRDESTAGFPRRPEEVRRHLADYYAMISHIDSRIGQVLEVLQQRNMMEDTIIVLCGDNGLAIGQHGLMGKQNLYEHSTRVPLVMCGPGIPENQTRRQYVYLLDIYPTLCDLAQIPVPETVEGRSFAGMFADPTLVTRPDIYYSFQARIRGAADGRYKLLEYRSEECKVTQLFDLERDPWETENFFGFTGYDQITARLRRRMEEYREAWDEETHLYGRQFWEQYRRYQEAEVHGVDRPKGASMANQVCDWGKATK